ncbi:hypothetical protein LUZ62_083136 [Rhynchospora pubera]|uniref:Uncharacterized protein n=1 Tax=Rhynchospora pubera TaxID=906938 RepID=A0AAV8BZS6_9POAL|nr:hypothetical protein LUZ62_083136 [Rhynchospora pubera]
MSNTTSPCPSNSFSYNTSLCACNPGFYFPNQSTTSCTQLGAGNWSVGSGVSSGQQAFFLTTFFSIDSSIRRLTQSQAVLLETTLIVLVAWLIFCFCLRIRKIDQSGKSKVFKVRWWIGQLDFLFDTRHWTDEQKAVVRRKTELGGTFSVASWILFIGLLTALLYQVFNKRTIEVHRVKPANTPDLLSFLNDLEFNITAVSSMSCANLVGPTSLITGMPGFIDFRSVPLSDYVRYTCHNSSSGPTVSLRCDNCKIPRRSHFISWHFVDLPNNPATAVGFEFNLTARDHYEKKHVTYVSGTANTDGVMDASTNGMKTFRGSETNVLKIQLFPEEYINSKGLKLLRPLFNDFVPGSYFTDMGGLKASLENSRAGLVNTTLFISYQSDYIVQIDKESVLGPVSIMANIGGLYAISVAIFLYLLTQCETRILKLRNEDSMMRTIISRRRAHKNWDKVRKFVMYTWGPSNLDPTDKSGKLPEKSMIESLHGFGSLRRKGPGSRKGPVCTEKSNNGTTEMKSITIESPSSRCESNLIGNTEEARGLQAGAKMDNGDICNSSVNS